jgi:hypothetical protein
MSNLLEMPLGPWPITTLIHDRDDQDHVCFRFSEPRFSENQDTEISQLLGESAVWIK